MSGIWIIVIFLILIILRLPLAFSMSIPAIIYLYVEGIPFVQIPHKMVNSINSYTLLSVPLFIFAGNLMNESGLTDRIFSFVLRIVGRIRGGLAQVNILASLVFSGVSGAALADIGGIGKVLIDQMNKTGYRRRDSAALTAASATIGPIFPPSIPLIIYGATAEVSAVHLFIAGVIPAILLTILLMATVFYLSKRDNYPKHVIQEDEGNLLQVFLRALPALLTPVILIVGLLSGFFGPTELAAFTVVYIIFFGLIIYKELTFKKLIKAFRETINTTGMIMFIIASAALFAWTLTISQLSRDISDVFLSVSTNSVILLLMTAILLLIVGTVFESTAAILVFTPILYPPLMIAGVDPVHFGIVMVFALMIGLITPPVGVSLYLVAMISELSVEEVLKGLVPYFIVLLVTLLIIILLPSISLWLPTLIQS